MSTTTAYGGVHNGWRVPPQPPPKRARIDDTDDGKRPTTSTRFVSGRAPVLSDQETEDDFMLTQADLEMIDAATDSFLASQAATATQRVLPLTGLVARPVDVRRPGVSLNTSVVFDTTAADPPSTALQSSLLFGNRTAAGDPTLTAAADLELTREIQRLAAERDEFERQNRSKDGELKILRYQQLQIEREKNRLRQDVQAAREQRLRVETDCRTRVAAVEQRCADEIQFENRSKDGELMILRYQQLQIEREKNRLRQDVQAAREQRLRVETDCRTRVAAVEQRCADEIQFENRSKDGELKILRYQQLQIEREKNRLRQDVEAAREQRLRVETECRTRVAAVEQRCADEIQFEKLERQKLARSAALPTVDKADSQSVTSVSPSLSTASRVLEQPKRRHATVTPRQPNRRTPLSTLKPVKTNAASSSSLGGGGFLSHNSFFHDDVGTLATPPAVRTAVTAETRNVTGLTTPEVVVRRAPVPTEESACQTSPVQDGRIPASAACEHRVVLTNDLQHTDVMARVSERLSRARLSVADGERSTQGECSKMLRLLDGYTLADCLAATAARKT